MAVAALHKIASATDPKEAILKEIGDLGNVEVMAGRLLVAIYIGSNVASSVKTAQGGTVNILRPDSNVREDVWQDIVGLVLKRGPLAYKDDETHHFGGQEAKVGDWVVYQNGGPRRQIRGVDCRVIEDVHVEMVIDDPAIITHRK